MESNRSEDLFIRSQGLLVPDELNGESADYTPGSALRERDSSVSTMWQSRATLPRVRDYDANLFLRSQDLLDSDDMQMDRSHYTPGSASRSSETTHEGWRGKLMALRARGFERMGTVREKMGTVRETMSGKVGSMHESTMSRLSSMREEVSARMTAMRDGVTSTMSGAERNLRAHPVKWAGVAAGAGAGIGLAGRMMRARSARKREMPSFVIIEAC